MLEQQIESIMNQSIKIDYSNIHVWYNKGDKEQLLPINKNIKTYQSNWNSKFWGRFTIPLLLDTEYICVFDDDIIPNEKWLENCLNTIEKTNGILGGSGVLLKSDKYLPNQKYGWNGIHSDNIEKVDLVGHSWFFKQEWTKYLWYEKPFTWDNGEDIMFSYLSQKYGNINTFVPPHPEEDKKMWSCIPKIGNDIGNDDNASWKKKQHYGIRGEICEYCIKNGWKRTNG
jgi:hypothetical protein